MYGYNLTVLLLLCCLLIVDVTGRCPCQHRKRHRKCDSRSSDEHSSESSSESSEQHTKRTPNSTSNATVASTTTTTTQAPLATGSTGAPTSVPTTGPPALSTRATAAPPTGPTIAPPITGTPAASPSTRTTAASSGTVSTVESTKTTSTTTQKTTTLPGGPTTTFVRPTCCPSGWIRFNTTNSCYLVQNNANWSDAEQICVSKNAHLVSLHSDDEENFVLNLTRTGQPSSDVTSGIWIGLKAIVTGKSFEWTDGSPVDYTKWVVGSEPDGIGQYGRRYPANCVDVRIDWSNAWDDDNCWAVMRAFVCKQPVQNC